MHLQKLFPFLACVMSLSAAAVDAPVHDLQGVYTLDAAASDSINSAIENGTADMNFAIRGLARRRIAQTNPRYERIRLSRTDATIMVQFDSRAAIELPADGRSVPWTREDGGKYIVTAQWSAPQLLMHFDADDGQRTNTLLLSPDGLSLELKVRLTSSHLPKPIEYTLGYRRGSLSQGLH
jgi:hypothetical protein